MSNQFTADNIAGIWRAVPESDGSFKDVSERAEARGVSLSPFAIGCWVMWGARTSAGARSRRPTPSSPRSTTSGSDCNHEGGTGSLNRPTD